MALLSVTIDYSLAVDNFPNRKYIARTSMAQWFFEETAMLRSKVGSATKCYSIMIVQLDYYCYKRVYLYEYSYSPALLATNTASALGSEV